MWHYTTADHIADQYDEFFAENRLFEFDEQVLARHFSRPGLVVDLGCDTGRTLVTLARRGFRGLGVDLSPAMLRIVAEKARAENLAILADQSFDYAVCLFSTLGMIRGRGNRRRVLAHVRRVLKPDGLFVLHVHNFWFNLFDPIGRRWLAGHLLSVPFRRGVERGDKLFHYRGIPQMFLHTFTQGELRRELASAGFRIKELIPLAVSRQRPLRRPWLFGPFRANGWIVVCE